MTGATGARLQPGFVKLGWTAECDVIMVAKRPSDRFTIHGSTASSEPSELLMTWTEYSVLGSPPPKMSLHIACF